MVYSDGLKQIAGNVNRILFLLRIICLGLFVLLFCACENGDQNRLDLALETAGQNKSELLYILSYYRNQDPNSIKYKAAKYLIRNMYGMEFDSSASIRSYYDSLQSIYLLNNGDYKISQEQWDAFNAFDTPFDNIQPTSDLRYVSSQLIIDNIDRAFDLWQQPWTKELSFDEFCQYILPYKLQNEKPDFWRSQYKKEYSHFLDQAGANGEYDRTLLAKTLIDSLLSRKEYFVLQKSVLWRGGYSADFLKTLRMGSCEDFAIFFSYILRSQGIPISIDFVPQWANRSLGHTWTVIHLEDGSNIDYSFPEPSATMGHHMKQIFNFYKNRPPKVFRKTFEIQQSALGGISDSKDIPPLFQNPKLKDVTEEYVDCMDVKLQFANNSYDQQYAYLCCFDNTKWVPVQWGKICNGKVRFTKMGKGIAYLPAYYMNGEIVPASYPVIVHTDGTVNQLTPNRTQTHRVSLTRKYPDNYIRQYAQKLIHAKFQVADNPDFTSPVTLHTIDYLPEAHFNTIVVALDKPYRYFRILLQGNGELSGIEIYDNSNCKLGGVTLPNVNGKNLEAVLDNNPLTYFYTLDSVNGFWGFDFGQQKTIRRIRYLPRNDGNFITDGDEYELFYWDGTWVSLGRRKGSDTQALVFNDVPANALLLLHDITQGKEERIFTYEQDSQKWW